MIDAAIEKLETMLNELRSALPESIDELRLVEAQAAYAYFAAWQMLPLRWKGTGRKPIPTEWRHVVARLSMVSGRNRPRHTPGERDAQLRLRGAGEPGANRCSPWATQDPVYCLGVVRFSVAHAHVCHMGIFP